MYHVFGKTGSFQFTGVVVHEMLHIMGVIHEQNRPDRDNFVTINWANIQVSMVPIYTLYSAYQTTATATALSQFQIAYDWFSSLNFVSIIGNAWQLTSLEQCPHFVSPQPQ